MISDSKLRLALDLDPKEPTLGLLEDIRDRALAFIETQTGRYFGPPQTVTEWVTGGGGRYLQLSDRASVVTLTERAYPGATGASLVEVVDGAGHWVTRENANTTFLIRSGDGSQWAAGYEYEVTYQRGYEVDQGPKDIEALLIALVGARLAIMESEGMSGESIGGYSYTKTPIHAYDDGDLRAIPGAVRTINAWRRLVVA